MINKEQSEKKQGHHLEGTGAALSSDQTWGADATWGRETLTSSLYWLRLETFKITDAVNVYVVKTLISLSMCSGLSQKKIKSTEQDSPDGRNHLSGVAVDLRGGCHSPSHGSGVGDTRPLASCALAVASTPAPAAVPCLMWQPLRTPALDGHAFRYYVPTAHLPGVFSYANRCTDSSLSRYYACI